MSPDRAKRAYIAFVGLAMSSRDIPPAFGTVEPCPPDVVAGIVAASRCVIVRYLVPIHPCAIMKDLSGPVAKWSVQVSPSMHGRGFNFFPAYYQIR